MFALGFAISQGDIAAQTPTRMQGSEVKERKKITVNLPNRVAYLLNRSESNPYVKIGRRACSYHYAIEKSLYKGQNAVFNL